MSEWIEHDGGPCPVDRDSVIDAKFQSGRISYGKHGWFFAGKRNLPDIWKGEIDDSDHLIIAYRVVKP